MRHVVPLEGVPPANGYSHAVVASGRPTTTSTDHARECVPLLALGDPVHPVALGDRPTFSDLGATVAEWLNVGFRGRGTSFLPLLERGH